MSSPGSLPLSNRTAVVTGGGRGIGRAIALRFAADGCDVVITGRTTSQLAETATEAEGMAGRVIPIACDVASADSVAALAVTAKEALGSVDTLVNNAGIHAGGSFMNIEPDVYRELFEVNVIGVVQVSQAFLPDMIEAGFGRVINIASTAGLFESAGQAPYNTSKHAVVGLTRCMALELASKGVTANAICPGFVETAMLTGFAEKSKLTVDEITAQVASRTPMGRVLQPEEIAHLAAHLASDLAGGMTGQTIAISNGMRMH